MPVSSVARAKVALCDLGSVNGIYIPNSSPHGACRRGHHPAGSAGSEVRAACRAREFPLGPAMAQGVMAFGTPITPRNVSPCSVHDRSAGKRFLIFGGGDVILPMFLNASLYIMYKPLAYWSIGGALFGMFLNHLWLMETRRPLPALPFITLGSILAIAVGFLCRIRYEDAFGSNGPKEYLGAAIKKLRSFFLEPCGAGDERVRRVPVVVGRGMTPSSLSR